jgi:hypothetical protein
VQVGPTVVTRERTRYTVVPLAGGGYAVSASTPETISQPVKVFVNITQRNSQEEEGVRGAAQQQQQPRPRWGLWG